MYRIEIDYRKSGSAFIPSLKTGIFPLRPPHPRKIYAVAPTIAAPASSIAVLL